MGKLNLTEVSDNVLEEVSKLLNYSSVKVLKDDVIIIKEWMKTQPHLPEILDDKKIENFLILNKGSIERTKEKIDMYYTVRSLLPDIFENINPRLPYMKKILDTIYFVPLPQLTKDYYRVFLVKIRNRDLMEDLDLNTMIAFLMNSQEIRLAEDVTYGDVFIIDAKDASFNLLMKFTPTLIYKTLIVVYQRVFSMRMKGVYVVNAPSFTEKFLTMLKVFLKPKIIDRIHIHQDCNFLIERFGKENIPKDYGGEGRSLEDMQELVRQQFVNHQKRFDQLDKLRVIEELRPNKLRNDEDLGYYGNFKKLSID